MATEYIGAQTFAGGDHHLIPVASQGIYAQKRVSGLVSAKVRLSSK